MFARPSSLRFSGLLLAGGVLLLAGCQPVADYRLNMTYVAVQKKQNGVTLSTAQLQNLKGVLQTAFGTPDKPQLPGVEGLELDKILNPSKLEVAAGRVGRDQTGRARGLYRKHCAHCHGITGDGAGPTAEFLNPYPRDYRRGLFKFKSTKATHPPTPDDLMRILVNGIPGTAMPSFKLLQRDELDALIHYVRYLAIRGEVERLLIASMVTELDEGELLFDPSAEASAQADQITAIQETISAVAQKWIDAPSQVTPVPPPPENVSIEESIQRGREIFYGAVAQCVKCHGPAAIGDGVTNDYDEWIKELDPKNPETYETLMIPAGAHPARPIIPRNLRLNVFRGGRRPVDLYWRIHNGIAGSPMPAASMEDPKSPDQSIPRKTLRPDDVWHLIRYVRSLPYEPLSNPLKSYAPTNQRERN